MKYTYNPIPWFICIALIIVITYLCIKLWMSKQVTKSIIKKEISADQALQMLIQGNNEYIQSGTSSHDRKSVMQTQHPFAIILSCSDSRVSPELIFDQLHAASLFIVRNAGNIVDHIVLGSIEFGVKYLEAPLIIVLGHERCGAVTAAVDATLEDKQECAIHIKNIIDVIKPSVQTIVKNLTLTSPISQQQKNDLIKKAAFENIHRVINQISQDSPIISQAINEKKIKLIGAYYDLDYGNLEFID